MDQPKQLPLVLLVLRLGIFIVFLMWSLDKFFQPEHTSLVFERFYRTVGFGSGVSYIIGALELLLTIVLVLGIKKRITYGVVFVLHLISTLSSYKQYFEPQLLFFAAWPMLAACFALYVLREHDTLWTFKS